MVLPCGNLRSEPNIEKNAIKHCKAFTRIAQVHPQSYKTLRVNSYTIEYNEKNDTLQFPKTGQQPNVDDRRRIKSADKIKSIYLAKLEPSSDAEFIDKNWSIDKNRPIWSVVCQQILFCSTLSAEKIRWFYRSCIIGLTRAQDILATKNNKTNRRQRQDIHCIVNTVYRANWCNQWRAELKLNKNKIIQEKLCCRCGGN